MRSMRWRLDRLERLPQMKPPPTTLDQIWNLAWRRISNEHFDLLVILKRDLAAGVKRLLSESEQEAGAALSAALEAEAQNMGFKSYSQAERCEM